MFQVFHYQWLVSLQLLNYEVWNGLGSGAPDSIALNGWDGDLKKKKKQFLISIIE